MATIFVDPGNHNCLNFGDLAMLQVAIRRWSTLWPSASIEVITNAPHAIAKLGPEVRPLSIEARSTWLRDHVAGRFHRMLPAKAAAAVEAGEWRMKLSAARPLEAALTTKQRLSGKDVVPLASFLRSVRAADLVMLSGSGIMTDAFFHNVAAILDTFDIALRRRRGRKPATAMFGQGFGPLIDAVLRRKASSILPQLDLIAIRERRASWQLLRELGVDEDRIVVTGDDAIELAYERRKPAIGEAIGVNVRVAYYAETDASLLHRVKHVLHRAGRRYGVPLVPLPISRQEGGIDAAAIRELLAGYIDDMDGGTSLSSPIQVIDEVARCRLVVTGSYHAAVFALAQGVPAIGLVGSQYYRNKFLGLADQFGGGIEVLEVDAARFALDLDAALERTWNAAEQRRPALLRAAERQIELSTQAYRRVAEIAKAARPHWRVA